MFGLEAMMLIFVALAGLSTGAVAYAFLLQHPDPGQHRSTLGIRQLVVRQTDRYGSVCGEGLARPGRRSCQAGQIRPGNSQGTLGKAESQGSQHQEVAVARTDSLGSLAGHNRGLLCLFGNLRCLDYAADLSARRAANSFTGRIACWSYQLCQGVHRLPPGSQFQAVTRRIL